MEIGRTQELEVMRESPHGLYLSDGEEEVLLPRGQVPPGTQFGEMLRVFVLTDSEDRPVATTKVPFGEVGDFAALSVVSVTPAGAFLDWGLDKDLFCPRREQVQALRVGQRCVVRIYLDELSDRVVCTTRLNRFTEPHGRGLQIGEKVSILVVELSQDWVSAIIEGTIRASIYPDEWHEKLTVGEVRDAYVKAVRPEDGKVALSLRPQGFKAALGERDQILAKLRENGGRLAISDNSSPEEIHRMFGLSKGMFKKVIGAMYRDGLIALEANAIRLKAGRGG